jgi:hypothetical protein
LVKASTKSVSRRKGPPRSHKLDRRPLIFQTLLVLSATFMVAVWWFHEHYTVNFQSPLVIRFQSPVVVAERLSPNAVDGAQADQYGRHLSAWQQYACRKFGSDCRLALAIQRAENAAGKCEVYHYNSDGTLDWGYFQINTVHLRRAGVNLRDLLDCKANIDFAYQLYRESGGFTPWSTFNSGAYRRYLRE